MPTIAVSHADPFADDALTDPYPFHDELREAGPAVWLERYGVWAVARHADVERALRDPATFGSARGVGLSDFAKEKPWRPPSLLLEADPPDHARARKVITSVLSPKTVAAMRAAFTATAEQLVETVLSGGAEVEAVGALTERFPLAVFPDQLGLPHDGRENLLPYGCMVFNGFGPPNAHFERAMARGAVAREWIMDVTRRERLVPGALGDQVHGVALEHGYSPDEAGMIVRSFLSAGVDTTVHALGNALLCFSRAPEQWEALREDPAGRARAAFEEVVRFESPVQAFFRTTMQDADVDGVALPAGDKVLLFFAAANRDPRRWEDPGAFDIRRRATGHVGFGSGIHACVGQMMARLEGEVLLAALAQRVARIVPAGEPVRQLNNTLRGLDRLPLRLETA